MLGTIIVEIDYLIDYLIHVLFLALQTLAGSLGSMEWFFFQA